jgi:hypothetical protein
MEVGESNGGVALFVGAKGRGSNRSGWQLGHRPLMAPVSGYLNGRGKWSGGEAVGRWHLSIFPWERR